MKQQDWCFKGSKQWKLMREHLHWEPLIGYMAYMIGALFFNLNTGLSYANVSEGVEKYVIWMAATLGSVLFTLGGYFECNHNHVFKSFKWGNVTHWLSIFNFLGGVFFLIAGVCGLAGVKEPAYMWLVDFTYLVGSAFFLFGGFCALYLWKGESFGLGLLSELNVQSKHQEKYEKLMEQ